MLKQDWMTIVAGEELVDALTAEQQALIPQDGQGYFKSEPLCRLQQEQAARGIVGAEIVRSVYGNSVRYDSGLQDFGLLASSRAGMLDGTLGDAIRWATEWVSRDPAKRYAWHRSQS